MPSKIVSSMFLVLTLACLGPIASARPATAIPVTDRADIVRLKDGGEVRVKAGMKVGARSGRDGDGRNPRSLPKRRPGHPEAMHLGNPFH